MRRVYLLFGVVAFAIAASAPPVSARDKGQGYYFDIGPSYAVFGDSELSSGAELSAEDGLGAAVAIGYRYGGGFRSEFEAGFRRNDLDSVSAAGTFFGTAVAANAALNGDVSTAYGLINLYYDIDMRSAWSPYVGAGIGGASVELDSTTLDVDDTDTVLAYQALIGASYRFPTTSGREAATATSRRATPRLPAPNSRFRTIFSGSVCKSASSHSDRQAWAKRPRMLCFQTVGW